MKKTSSNFDSKLSRHMTNGRLGILLILRYVIQRTAVSLFILVQPLTEAFHPSYCKPAAQTQAEIINRPNEKRKITQLLLSSNKSPSSKGRQYPFVTTLNKPYPGPFHTTPVTTDNLEEFTYNSTSFSSNHNRLHFLDKNIISDLLTIVDDDVNYEKYSNKTDNFLDVEEDDNDVALGYERMSHLDHLYVSQAVQSTQPFFSLNSKQNSAPILNDNNNNNYTDEVVYNEDNRNQKRWASSTTTTTATTTTKRRVSASVKETGYDALSIYLKNIANHDLLRHEEEIVLGKQIQVLVYYEQQRLLLESSLLRKPTFTEWAKVVNETSAVSLKKQIRRSQRAKAAMIEANLRNVITIARQLYRRQQKKQQNNHKESSGISFQDLCQQGMLGLNKACERFDPNKGVRFYTYANWYIQQEVQRSMEHDRNIIRLPPNAIAQINAIRIAEVQLMENSHKNTHHHHPKKPTDEEIAKHLGFTVDKVKFLKRAAREALSIHSQVTNGGKKKGGSAGSTASAEEDGVTLEHILHDPQQETPVDLAAKKMLQEDVRRLIQTLTPREQAVIRLRYGLDDGLPQSLGAIAQQFDVSKERIRKIESSALVKLRQPYRHESVKSYVSDL